MLPLRVAADGTPVPGNILQEEFHFAFFEISLHLCEFRERYRVCKQTVCPKIYTRDLWSSLSRKRAGLVLLQGYLRGPAIQISTADVLSNSIPRSTITANSQKILPSGFIMASAIGHQSELLNVFCQFKFERRSLLGLGGA